MLRISGLSLPDRTFSREELEDAFAQADFGRIRIPGRKQVMDAHEVRGLFQTYLFMAGASWAGPSSEAIEVPEDARPFVEALRRVHGHLLGDESRAFAIETVADPS